MPPRWSTTTLCVSVFFSSSAKLDLTSNFSPTNFGGRMAAFADFASWAEIHHWRRDRLGNAIEGYFNELLGAVHLGLEMRRYP